MDWFDKAVAVAWLALTWRQNRILDKANPPAPDPSWKTKAQNYLSRYWPMAVMILLGMLVWLPRFVPSLVGSETITGTMDIPAGSIGATVPVSASLPYTIRHLTPDWETSGIFVVSRESGHFEVGFNRPPPAGGGELEWEVAPRVGSQEAAAAIPTDTPTAEPSPPPKPWQTFIQGSGASQIFAQQIQNNPIPGSHTVSIVATEESHRFAAALLGWLQGRWTIIEHGTPGAFIGQPSEYALDDGITIRARAASVDAETLRLAFLVAGLNVHRVFLPDSDNRTYPIIEIGNIPADQR
jgi:hypothetical protein